jgi:hypothetical protein
MLANVTSIIRVSIKFRLCRTNVKPCDIQVARIARLYMLSRNIRSYTLALINSGISFRV